MTISRLLESMEAEDRSVDDIMRKTAVANKFVGEVRHLDPDFKEVKKVLEKGYGISEAKSQIALECLADSG